MLVSHTRARSHSISMGLFSFMRGGLGFHTLFWGVNLVNPNNAFSPVGLCCDVEIYARISQYLDVRALLKPIDDILVRFRYPVGKTRSDSGGDR